MGLLGRYKNGNFVTTILSDGTKIRETKDYEFIDSMFREILKYNFNNEDIELIDWWLYERRSNPELKMYIDKKEVPTETIEDIWNLL